jgi:hypothetical protein
MATYLQIDYSTGNIFQFSKTEQEGYEPHTNTKGVVSYRKIFKKGLYGTLKGVTIRESDFGKEISVAVTDSKGEATYLNMPLFDAKKNLASYAESFITVLPQLKINNTYRFYGYNIKEEGQKYSKTGLSVAHADIQAETADKENKIPKLSYTYTKDGVEVKGDIPAIIWEEDFDGSRSMNAKAKNKYLYDVLMANVGESTQTASPTPQATSPAKQEPTPYKGKVEMSAPIADKAGFDDLPFG